jgi:hypothetical protein
MRKTRKRVPILLVVLIITTLIGAELALRKFLGLGDATILFQEDTGFEYIAQPNQDKIRFGNRVVYNEYSMRSLPLSEDDKCVVLGFGDSVINGGVLTDQDSLATTIVEKKVRKEANDGFRFLNISAGSWGPDNCAAYLKKFGSFEAKMIVLFVSSHDAYDNMTFKKIVGVHESYPNRTYPLALFELVNRYLTPRVSGAFSNGVNSQVDSLMINKSRGTFNPGFDFFRNYSRENNIPLVVCLHAETTEVENGSFNEQGKEILSYCANNGIKVISGLEIGEQLSDFSDEIHINESGQKRWARYLYPEIYQTINGCR